MYIINYVQSHFFINVKLILNILPHSSSIQIIKTVGKKKAYIKDVSSPHWNYFFDAQYLIWFTTIQNWCHNHKNYNRQAVFAFPLWLALFNAMLNKWYKKPFRKHISSIKMCPLPFSLQLGDNYSWIFSVSCIITI